MKPKATSAADSGLADIKTRRASRPVCSGDALDASSLAQSYSVIQRAHLDCPFSLESVMRDSILALPERALLVAILMQAYRDATRPPRSDKMRVIYLEARAFFAKPGLLEWFCELLDIDPVRLRKAALLANRQKLKVKNCR